MGYTAPTTRATGFLVTAAVWNTDLVDNITHLNIGRGTSLPASPADGQQYDYVADDTNGIIWRFRYRSASASTYKWEFVGGGYLSAIVDTAETHNGDSTLKALATAGPSITVPLAGDYDVEVSADILHSVADAVAYMTYDVGVTGGLQADGVTHRNGFATGGVTNGRNHLTRSRRKTGLTASTALVSKYWANGSGNATFTYRSLRAIPVRVG